MSKFKLVDTKGKTQSLHRKRSTDDLYTGLMVRELPDKFEVKIAPRDLQGEIMDLDFEATKASLKMLKTEKPKLSKQAWTRLSSKSRGRTASSHGPEDMKREEVAAMRRTESADHPSRAAKARSSKEGTPERHPIPLVREPSAEVDGRQDGVDALRLPDSPSLEQLRISMVSTDSGLGEDPSQNDRETATHGTATENIPTSLGGPYGLSASISVPSSPSPPTSSSAPAISHSLGASNVHLRLPKSGLPAGSYSSMRLSTTNHRKSMLLSELCVVTVSVPADTAQAQKGRGAQLKFRFSPYTQIEFLRIAILKVKEGVGVMYAA